MAIEKTFKALADPVRRQILIILKEGKLSAGEICEHFSLTGATTSYHLKILKEAELIYEEKEKNFIYYSLNTSVLEDVMVWFSEFNIKEKKHGKNKK